MPHQSNDGGDYDACVNCMPCCTDCIGGRSGKRARVHPIPLLLLWLSFGGMVAVAVLAMVKGGEIDAFPNTVGDVSDKYLTPVTPGDETFYIWTFIYAVQLLFVLVVTFAGGATLERIGLVHHVVMLQALNYALNAAWIIAWTNEFLWTSFFVLLLNIVVLAAAYMWLHVGCARVMSFWERLVVHPAVSVNLAWLVYALGLQIAVLAVSSGYSAGIAQDWGIFVLFPAALGAVVAAWRNADWAWVMVAAWAAGWIAESRGVSDAVSVFCIVAAVVAALFLIPGFLVMANKVSLRNKHGHCRRALGCDCQSYHAYMILSTTDTSLQAASAAASTFVTVH